MTTPSNPDATDVETSADLLWQAGTARDPVLQSLRGRLSIDAAYRVQLALLDRTVKAGEVQVGWKVGLTSAQLRSLLGHPEPVFGHLLESGRYTSGSTLDPRTLIRPAFEVELCMTMGSELRGPGVTLAQARAAIASVAPALEIIERRVGGAHDMALNIADDVSQKAFVVGPPVPLGVRDLAAVSASVGVNDSELAQASGSAVLGDPVASIAWLANALAPYGRHLRAGEVVMSGAFMPPTDIGQGDVVRADFGPVGVVEARFGTKQADERGPGSADQRGQA